MNSVCRKGEGEEGEERYRKGGRKRIDTGRGGRKYVRLHTADKELQFFIIICNTSLLACHQVTAFIKVVTV